MSTTAKSSSPIRIGILGLGRSGWFNHALILQKLPGQFTLAAVTDPDPFRCQEAVRNLQCRSHPDAASLMKDPEVDLIVVATPSQLHASQTIEALEAGKDVVCEKPMARDTTEADRMIRAAQKARRLLTVFQNNRYMPSFQQVRQVIASGKLGRIVQIRMSIHSFGRRWDWQTLKEFGGGELNNTGPHFLDQALQLFGPAEPQVFCHLERTLTSGDAEDYVKLVLRAPDAPLIDLEISKAFAYPLNLWQVTGTQGGLSGTASELSWKYVDFSRLPPRPVDRKPTTDRSYNTETYEWIQESWKMPPDGIPTQTRFYQDLYRTIRHQAPLVITPQDIRRQIALIEHCHRTGSLN